MTCLITVPLMPPCDAYDLFYQLDRENLTRLS